MDIGNQSINEDSFDSDSSESNDEFEKNMDEIVINDQMPK
jgi:hypothetical protein